MHGWLSENTILLLMTWCAVCICN